MFEPRVSEEIKFAGIITGAEFVIDVMELLRKKEQELLKVKRQVEALRIAAPLLGEDDPVTAAITPVTGRENSN